MLTQVCLLVSAHIFGKWLRVIFQGHSTGFSSNGLSSVWHYLGHQEEAGGFCEGIAEAVCVPGHSGH